MSDANNQYLSNILLGQTLSTTELDGLRNLRETIERQLSVLEGSPRFYYGGSFGKTTMVKARYDLSTLSSIGRTPLHTPSKVYMTPLGRF
jgi:hypothetical protein